MRTRMMVAALLAGAAASLSACGSSSTPAASKTAGTATSASTSAAAAPVDQMATLKGELQRAGLCDDPGTSTDDNKFPDVSGYDQRLVCRMLADNGGTVIWRVLAYTFPTEEAKQAMVAKLHTDWGQMGGYQSTQPGQRWIVLVNKQNDRRAVLLATGAGDL